MPSLAGQVRYGRVGRAATIIPLAHLVILEKMIMRGRHSTSTGVRFVGFAGATNRRVDLFPGAPAVTLDSAATNLMLVIMPSYIQNNTTTRDT